ncbi:PAS sensor domain-containing protein [Marinobacter vulgaris]|uniref:PAS sensor domain-containing protein n=1 Tax=Marinobacter vulgaris TaxID=1928331 RepID=A0A2V3ZHD9_9GAMM|nr:PAS domain S-box protein [Marinobacter vulgaris]PXX89604.1 PAS sensor domain-containing protein [Marinobacter vulgaris]TSJ68593.1 PAS domain S-box protein [Marinobacter vulgaris]
MNNSKEMLESPLFKTVAGLAFESVMVTEATADHKNSVIVYVNQAFSNLTGYSAEEVLGKTPGLLQGPETESGVKERLADDLKNNRTFHGTTINYRKDGSAFTIEWKIAPVMDGDTATHYVAVQRAID